MTNFLHRPPTMPVLWSAREPMWKPSCPHRAFVGVANIDLAVRANNASFDLYIIKHEALFKRMYLMLDRDGPFLAAYNLHPFDGFFSLARWGEDLPRLFIEHPRPLDVPAIATVNEAWLQYRAELDRPRLRAAQSTSSQAQRAQSAQRREQAKVKARNLFSDLD